MESCGKGRGMSRSKQDTDRTTQPKEYYLSTGHGDVGGDAVRSRGGEGTMAGNRLTMLFLPLSAWLVSVAKERNRPPAASAR